MKNANLPELLAPAGSKDSFLAALAADADAIYCGLKHFNARMEAENFSITELAGLTELAHKKNTKVFVTINTLLKVGEEEKAGRLIDRLEKIVHPDALIIQDVGLIEIAKQTKFSGELHLSTLAATTSPTMLNAVAKHSQIKRVVLPRELNIDEIKEFSNLCPPDLKLETFIHGALCYAVSGRCYWSSYMGGKSGLRGRCVQPCRRIYTQNDLKKRMFSSLDFSLDVLTKALLNLPKICSWKIEGRKKGPHYIFYVLKAYQILREPSATANMKKSAQQLLTMALSRPTSHYNFLPQRAFNPLTHDNETSSGLFIGAVKGSAKNPYINPRIPILAGDMIRIGSQDQQGHAVIILRRNIPKGGQLDIKSLTKNTIVPGTSSCLIDRREPEMMKLLKTLNQELDDIPVKNSTESDFVFNLPKAHRKGKIITMSVARKGKTNSLWLSADLPNEKPNGSKSTWWWLPPIIWPNEENNYKTVIENLISQGHRNFVLGQIWQRTFFPNSEFNLWTSPFCNISNHAALTVLFKMGFQGAFVSPELSRADFLHLPAKSPIQLGVVLKGNWPLSMSRITPPELELNTNFSSPMKESAWCTKYGETYYLYPDWELNISQHERLFLQAGYSAFAKLREPLPKNITLKSRPGLWNWDLQLL